MLLYPSGNAREWQRAKVIKATCALLHLLHAWWKNNVAKIREQAI